MKKSIYNEPAVYKIEYEGPKNSQMLKNESIYQLDQNNSFAMSTMKNIKFGLKHFFELHIATLQPCLKYVF